jgi:hypothetical protein
MRSILFIGLCFVFTIGNKINAFAQNDKLEFTAKWESDTTNTIKITVTNVELPVKCYIYESSPFTGGILIKTVENVNSENFKVEVGIKKRVYICVYKDEANLSTKWLNIR